VSHPRKALRRFLSCRTPRALRRLRDTGDEGFTLIELIIVLIILPLILGAIAVALITTLQDSVGLSTRISDSVDAQITAAFYVRDVQSSQFVTTSAVASTPWSAAAGRAKCGAGAATALVVSLAWASGAKLATGKSVETVVSYWRTAQAVGSGTVTANVLTSKTPEFGVGDVGQQVVQTNGSAIPFGTLIKKVTSSTVVTLSKTTSGGSVSFAVGPTLIRDFCTGGTSTPSSVTTSRDFFTPFFRAEVSCPTPKATCANWKTTWVSTQGVTSIILAVMAPAGRYNYNISAVPRVSNGTGPEKFGTPFTYTLPTLLLIGGVQRVVKEDATANVTVRGRVSMNTGYFQQTNKATFTATKIETTDTPVTGICSVPRGLAHCTGTITPPAKTAVHITAPIPDPFASLTDPPALPTMCSAVGSGALPPGQYHCAVSISGTGRTLTLSGGIYEFDTGLSVNGGASLTGSGGVLIYLPCNKVDTWAPQCQETFAVKNSQLTVKGLSGAYPTIWLWENAGDTAQITLAGPGGFDVTGILYAPRAQVKLAGGTTTSAVGSIIAYTLWVHNGTFVITGTTRTGG
jgi:prepilin-type N-terminal cleavage/methylation domain-containing protein